MNRTIRQLLIVAVVVVFALAAFADERESGANWPRWRGPEGSGVSAEKNLPGEWSSTQNIAWKTPLPGRGHSSPVVWGNRIFLTAAIMGDVAPGAKAPIHMINGKPWKHPDAIGSDHRHTLKVLALDRDTGKIVWERTAYEGTIYDDYHKKNTSASPTPVTDGKKVYAYFGSEGLYAYNLDGKLAWKVEIPKIGTMSVGSGTSPILFENLLILQCDREDGADSDIVAYDKETGKTVWRTLRNGVEISWATPIIVDAPGGPQLIASGSEFIIAYNPRTGNELWRMEGVKSNAIPSPLAGHGLVYLSAGFPKKKVIAVRVGTKTESGAPEIAWTYDRGTAYVPSPVLYGDYLYLTSDKGILTCLDAKTGAVLYDDGRVPVPATFMASLLAYNGEIYQFGQDGDTFVVRAGPKHEVLRTNSLGEPVYSTPSVAGGRLYIRGEKHLYAIRAGGASAAKKE